MLVKTTTLLLEGLANPANLEVWREFDGRYRPVLEAFARRMGLPDGDADEIAQAVLARFVERYRAGEYDRARGRLRSWIFGIARTRVADWKRERARRREERGTSGVERLEDGVDPEAAFDAEWRNAILREALEALRTRTRTEPQSIRVLEMLVLEQRPAAEVARALAMTPNAVYQARHRTLQGLREIVSQLESDS